MTFGDMSVDQAIRLFYEKNDALKRNDFLKLRSLQMQHPQLFNKRIDNEIRSFIQYIHAIQKNPGFEARYQEHLKAKAKK